jgi:mercuric reductase
MPDIQDAVDRLEGQLPLQRRQRELPPGIADAHRAILRSFAATGRPPGRNLIERIAGIEATTVIGRLAAGDLIVVTDGRIVGAYPFSLTPTPHLLSMDALQVHAMCALDAVAVAPVFDLEVVTNSQCAVSGSPIRLHQLAEAVEASEPEGLRIGVRWQEPDGCAAQSMCREMVFLSDGATAEHWRGPQPDAAGIFDLSQAIEFGTRFFGPLLQD